VKTINGLASALLLSVCAISGHAAAPAWSDPSPHREGFVTVNGVRLEYLDWGGTGEALILIHGLGDNPHIFDDLAPSFTGRFHVIAYARRGQGRSDTRGPYDNDTLTEDLRGLMDALGIDKADLVGWSMGGNEITAMAARHPERVVRVVYLDGGYDYQDTDFDAGTKKILSALLDTPPSALASLDAYRSYEKATVFPSLDDMRRVEAYIRASVIIQPDGRAQPRVTPDVENALYASLVAGPPRDYAHMRVPVLAIYAQSTFNHNISDAPLLADARAWEQVYFDPFRLKSIERLRRELVHVEIVHVPGAHGSFFLTSRDRVVTAMRRFFAEPSLSANQ
jgi:pimeloyl-ACP methyl ester carboxylesterase